MTEDFFAFGQWIQWICQEEIIPSLSGSLLSKALFLISSVTDYKSNENNGFFHIHMRWAAATPFHPLLLLASWLISHQHRVVDISLKILCLWQLSFFCPRVVLPTTHSCLACLAVFLSTFKTQFQVDHIWKCDPPWRVPGLPLLPLSIFFILDLIPTCSSVSLLGV